MENLLPTPVGKEQVIANHLAKAQESPQVLSLGPTVGAQNLKEKTHSKGPGSLALSRLVSRHS